LSASDFERILRDHFAEVELYGQRRLQTRRHRLVQRLDVLGLRRRLPFLRPAARLLGTAPMADVTLDEIVIARGDLGRASELVAVCAGPRRERSATSLRHAPPIARQLLDAPSPYGAGCVIAFI